MDKDMGQCPKEGFKAAIKRKKVANVPFSQLLDGEIHHVYQEISNTRFKSCDKCGDALCGLVAAGRSMDCPVAVYLTMLDLCVEYVAAQEEAYAEIDSGEYDSSDGFSLAKKRGMLEKISGLERWIISHNRGIEAEVRKARREKAAMADKADKKAWEGGAKKRASSPAEAVQRKTRGRNGGGRSRGD
ncbi:MAG: hypothetical protein LBT92_03025 [Rickettsiales bacterium]|jgi:hypothetical protein|nr:hypothetical protein [Rickettsiales bacterium]